MMPRKNNTRRPSAFIQAGWCGTKFHGRSAFRGPSGWVAVRHEGKVDLWIDDHAGARFFASYPNPAKLLADICTAERLPRTRREAPKGDEPPTPVYGTWKNAITNTPVVPDEIWNPLDPRWD
jgi:hypothetical protein